LAAVGRGPPPPGAGGAGAVGVWPAQRRWRGGRGAPHARCCFLEKCPHPPPPRRSLVPLTHTPTRCVSSLCLAPDDCCGAPCRRAAAASPARGQAFPLSAAPLCRQRPPRGSAAWRLTRNGKRRRRPPQPAPSAPALQATCRRCRRRRHCHRCHRCQPRRGGGGGGQRHVGGRIERRGGNLPPPPPHFCRRCHRHAVEQPRTALRQTRGQRRPPVPHRRGR